jgi:hypothetical protein
MVANSTRPGMTIRQSDETRLPERSVGPGGEERCAVRSRGECWGKPVCRLAELNNLAGRQSGLGAGANLSATERAHQRNGGRIDAECRRSGLVTKQEMQRNGASGVHTENDVAASG